MNYLTTRELPDEQLKVRKNAKQGSQIYFHGVNVVQVVSLPCSTLQLLERNAVCSSENTWRSVWKPFWRQSFSIEGL